MELLQQGQKISLNIEKRDILVEIIGTIADVFDDRLIVELPAYFMRYVEYLDVGCILTAKVFSKLGTIDFNSIVISSPLEEGHLEMELDVNALKFTPSNEIPVIDSIETFKFKRKNEVITTQAFEISTEYIKFYSDTELTIDESFECELLLPDDYGSIKFKGTVSEHDIIYDKEYTATIFSMNEQDREALLYYMYIYENNKPAFQDSQINDTEQQSETEQSQETLSAEENKQESK